MTVLLTDKIQRDLASGTAWLVVLAAIERSEAPIHGYEIARQLSEESPEGLNFKQGTLYPMLRTMEAEGLISSTLVPSNEGPARKCFRLTPEGRRTLSTWISFWKGAERWVNRVISGTGLSGGSNAR
ncbi:MAG: PadR family transcriptional regulator [Planctomycetes bacterium]|nr:PadR family transcriptional regulator [Planctomycetota bacterium]